MVSIQPAAKCPANRAVHAAASSFSIRYSNPPEISTIVDAQDVEAVGVAVAVEDVEAVEGVGGAGNSPVYSTPR
jgi:hypothetical protein